MDPVKLNGFVNPQITDFLTINWNKVINWYNLVTCSKEKKNKQQNANAEPQLTWGGSVAPQQKVEEARMRRQGEETGGDALVSEEQHWSHRWKKQH